MKDSKQPVQTSEEKKKEALQTKIVALIFAVTLGGMLAFILFSKVL